MGTKMGRFGEVLGSPSPSSVSRMGSGSVERALSAPGGRPAIRGPKGWRAPARREDGGSYLLQSGAQPRSHAQAQILVPVSVLRSVLQPLLSRWVANVVQSPAKLRLLQAPPTTEGLSARHGDFPLSYRLRSSITQLLEVSDWTPGVGSSSLRA